jgi:hypothetical protein
LPPTVDRQIQEMNELSRLGAAVGSPVELAPPSHRDAVGPIALLVFALAALGVAGWMTTNPSAAPYALSLAAAGLFLLLIAAARAPRRSHGADRREAPRAPHSRGGRALDARSPAVPPGNPLRAEAALRARRGLPPPGDQPGWGEGDGHRR